MARYSGVGRVKARIVSSFLFVSGQDDGGDDGVDLGAGDDFFHGAGAGDELDAGAQHVVAQGFEVVGGLVGGGLVVEGDVAGLHLEGGLGELFPTGDGGERVNFELVGQVAADVDGVGADGAGGAEDGDAAAAR